MKTGTIQTKLLGSARKELKQAAGKDNVISKADEKALPKDLQKVIAQARKTDSRVTVSEAVDAYAAYVSKALNAVDKANKGDVSKTEAKAISDLALRSKVLDIVDSSAPTGGPGPVNRGELDWAIEDAQTEWGDANIMDGHVSLEGTIVAGNNVKTTAERDFEALLGDAFDAFSGARTFDGPRALTKTDATALARAVNDDGLQYANTDELPHLRGQVESIIKKLGGPNGLEVAVVKQNVEVHGISDTDKFPAQLWTIRNPVTNDAVSFAVRKGSL
jgi:hypothetical protein